MEYFVLETVPGVFYSKNRDFKIKETDFEINATSEFLRVAYALRSELGISDILSNRVAVSWISQSVIGQGFSNSVTDIFEMKDEKLLHCGSYRNEHPPMQSPPLFTSAEDNLKQFGKIMQFQIPYRCFRRDSITACLSQVEGGGFINSRFAWTWWGLEWFLFGLSRKTRPREPLGFYVKDTLIQKRKVSRLYRPHYRSSINEFLAKIKATFSEIGNAFTELDIDSKYALKKSGVEAFYPSVMDLFNEHSKYIKELLKEGLNSISDTKDKGQISYWLENWSKVKQMIGKARNARHSMFHTGKYEGLLKGSDKYDKLREFVAFVSLVLHFALTRPPTEYDTEVAMIESVQLPKDREIVPFDLQERSGKLTWQTIEQGDKVSMEILVNEFATDEQLINVEVLDWKDTILFGPRRGSLTQVRPVVDALYTIETESCVIRGYFGNSLSTMKVVSWEKKST